MTSNTGDSPHVVNTTYVTVENETVSVSQYKRLSSDEDNEMIVDPNLLQIVQRSPSDSSEDEDINSSDDERCVKLCTCILYTCTCTHTYKEINIMTQSLLLRRLHCDKILKTDWSNTMQLIQR